jgi:hypothetical protein
MEAYDGRDAPAAAVETAPGEEEAEALTQHLLVVSATRRTLVCGRGLIAPCRCDLFALGTAARSGQL